MFRVNAGRIILLKQLFQPLMPYRPDPVPQSATWRMSKTF
jgi:hypothetical protein